MAKNKQPKAAYDPHPTKTPRVGVSFTAIQHQKPSWRLRALDSGGRWCWRTMDSDDLERVLDKLQQFESMTWREIIGPDHHEIPVERLCTDAQNRLLAIRRDDVDTVVSLRIGAKHRVIGVRIDSSVQLLWWDPEHEVCPAPKKHT